MILMLGGKTAQKKVDELYESEDRFSLAMRGANDGLWDWNLETDEVYYSSRWKSLLGYDENELGVMIDTWKTLVHPDDHEYLTKPINVPEVIRLITSHIS